MRIRRTIKLRLTLTYVGLFLAAGTALVSVNYVLLSEYAYAPPGGFVVRLLPSVGGTAPEVTAGNGAQGPSPTRLAPAHSQALKDAAQRKASEVTLRNQLRATAQGRALFLSVLALGLMAIVSVGLGWLAAGRALRPIQDIARTARRASEGNRHERIGLRGPHDELQVLADAIDGMLDRLEVAFQSQKRFVANASHELRTPLSITRTAVDVALGDPRASRKDMADMALEVRAATDRAERLIDSLLALASSDQAVEATDHVDLADAVQDALEATLPERGERRLAVAMALEEAPVRGDRPLLERMVGNLVENAVRHNLPEGTVTVLTGSDGEWSSVAVSNTGPRVPDELIPSLFEPFRRGGTPRTGSDRGLGLGLSIVKAVVVNHGGGVEARPLPEGGLEVVVRLPRAAPEFHEAALAGSESAV
jgi:signal transduction histidine kinase